MMSDRANRRSPRLRDAIGDWRRWSARERLAAAILMVLLGVVTSFR